MEPAGPTAAAPPVVRSPAAAVLAGVLLVASLAVCVAGIPGAVLGRLQAAFPCGDADLDPAHPVCALADPGRADLGLLLVLPVPVAVTLGAIAAAVVLVVRGRPTLATAWAATALVLALTALVVGSAVLDVELHRIVRR